MGINPKGIAGRQKAQFQFIPIPVLIEVGQSMAEGANKYGAYNWRDIKINASDYYDSTFRHMTSWFDGEDIDPDSGVHHVSKAIAGLVVLRDAMIAGSIIDDRPNGKIGLCLMCGENEGHRDICPKSDN